MATRETRKARERERESFIRADFVSAALSRGAIESSSVRAGFPAGSLPSFVRSLARSFVRLSRHFSVNEPRVAGEPSWSTREARDPHHRFPRFNPPLQSRRRRRPRQVGRSTFYPYRTTPILHDFPDFACSPSNPPGSPVCNPFLKTHLRPVRLILLVLPFPPSSLMISPSLLLSLIATSDRHLRPPPPPSFSSSFSFPLSLPPLCHPSHHPFPVASRA